MPSHCHLIILVYTATFKTPSIPLKWCGFQQSCQNFWHNYIEKTWPRNVFLFSQLSRERADQWLVYTSTDKQPPPHPPVTRSVPLRCNVLISRQQYVFMAVGSQTRRWSAVGTCWLFASRCGLSCLFPGNTAMTSIMIISGSCLNPFLNIAHKHIDMKCFTWTCLLIQFASAGEVTSRRVFQLSVRTITNHIPGRPIWLGRLTIIRRFAYAK